MKVNIIGCGLSGITAAIIAKRAGRSNDNIMGLGLVILK